VNNAAQASSASGQLSSQLLAQLPRWILGLLIVLLGVRAALLVADLAGPPTPIARTSNSPPPPASRKVVDVPSILRANLFGQSPVASGPDAPVTNMSLRLPLVFADVKDEKHGFAAIGTNDNDVKVYGVGQDLPNGARLHAVYVDRVLLDRGGSIEALLVPPRAGAMQAAGNAPPSAAAGVSMERVQQIIRDNPGLINQIMSRQPVFQDGRLVGVRVNPGSNAQAFNRLGLRPNDLVTAINGLALDDQQRSNDVFNSLNGAAQARVTVSRNGRETELNLNLAEIANEAERLAETPPPAESEQGPESTR
jgi:general secretion pathway protein C